MAKSMLTGASDAEIKISYYEALKEFFNDSNRWLERICIMVVPNVLDYPVTPIEEGYIIRLTGVVDQNNTRQAALLQPEGVVHFFYPYSNIQPMWAVVAKTVQFPFQDGLPAPPCIPDWVLPRYGSGILRGLIGRLMVQTGQSWSNPQMGIHYLQSFRHTIQEARVDAMRGDTVGAQAWTYPQSFRVTSQRGGVSTFNINPSPPTVR